MDGSNLPSAGGRPPTLNQLIDGLRRPGGERLVPAARAAVRTPADPEWIAGRIKTLLSHYYRPETDPRVESMAASDWISALEHFPQFALEAAVSDHLENETVRPTPAHIVKLARHHRARVRDLIADMSKPKPVEADDEPLTRPTEEERKRMQAEVDRFLRRVPTKRSGA